MRPLFELWHCPISDKKKSGSRKKNSKTPISTDEPRGPLVEIENMLFLLGNFNGRINYSTEKTQNLSRFSEKPVLCGLLFDRLDLLMKKKMFKI